MKENELMLGDWVKIKTYGVSDEFKITEAYVYVKVAEICSGLITVDYNNDIKEHYRICENTEIEPISLTSEILEKNGFECKHKGEAPKRLYWILNVEGCSVKAKINGGLFLFDISGVPFQYGFYVPTVNKHIQYVHDLQHALRLCGIEKTIEL